MELKIVVFLQILRLVTCQWVQPYIEEANGVTVQYSDQKMVLEMNENDQIDFVLGKLTHGTDGRIDGDDINKFRIDLSTKELICTVELDYEKQKTFSFRIVAESVVAVELKLINVNDNPTKLSMIQDKCIVEEEKEAFKTDCKVSLKDPDGFEDNFQLKLLEYSEFFKFTCDGGCGKELTEDSATMETLQKLDYEKTRRYTFELEAHDGNFNEREKIEVTVKDIADEKPVWENIFASQQFLEETEQHFQVVAKDGDVEVEDDIEYFCKNQRSEITCTDDGWIHVGEIDRDEEDLTTIPFSIVAKEKGLAAMETEQQVIFIIDDDNDNEPVITLGTIQNNVLEFYESKYEKLADLITISVVDKDLSSHGTFTMSLESDTVSDVDTFLQIIPDTGYQEANFNLIISNADKLDYENDQTKTFELKITAQEEAEQTHKDIKTVTVKLKDWNDEEPEFKHAVYTTKVAETIGRKNSEVIPNIEELYAIDGDALDSIDYALVGSSIQKMLEIRLDADNRPEFITKYQDNVQIFDFEKDEEVKFQLEAKDTWVDDFQTSFHRVYAEIIITVTDVNDERPTISTSVSSITVKENTPKGEIIPGLEITGSDADKEHKLKFGINWEDSYATKDGRRVDDDFKPHIGCFVTEDNGKDKAILKIGDTVMEDTPDYEKFNMIYLKLTVEDVNQVEYERTNEVTLIINIENVNDKEPVFDPASLARERKVRENSPPIVTPVGFIAASDEDGDKITYSLEATNSDTPSGWIDIDPDTGELSVADEIDAEYNGGLRCLYYTVFAFDGLYITKADLDCIEIEDVNDHTPRLVSKDINTDLEEHEGIGTTVASFDIKDDDRDPPNNEVVFSLVDEISIKYLEINKDGVVTVMNDMDREGADSKFTVKIKFRDDPLNTNDQRFGNEEFTIDLKDINDNDPIISTTIITVSEQETAGKKLEEKIEATDKDDPKTENAKMVITILNIEAPLDVSFFDIDTPQTGGSTEATLTVQKELRTFFGTHTMSLEVKDLGQPERSTIKDITLEVTKYNFDAPVFQYPTTETIYLKPDQNMNVQLKMSNGDAMKNVKAAHEVEYKYPIKYTVYERNSPSLIFKINRANDYEGILVLIDTPQWKEDYEISILAEDQGDPPLTQTISTKISFFNIDDEPTYDPEDREITVQFDETKIGVGKTVMTREAKYKDESFNQPKYYNIRNNILNAFKVDGKGVLTLMEPLWVLNTSSRVMEIIASKNPDGNNNPAVESILVVNLDLVDLNDNKPIFDKAEDFAGISLTTPYDLPIVTVTATDLDVPTTIQYSMKPNSLTHQGDNLLDTHKFVVNSVTGDITISFSVTENMNGYYTFVVMASDGEFESEEGILITVYIIFSENLISFAFSNSKDEVVLKKSQIQDIMSQTLEYDCTIQSITEISAATRDTVAAGGTEVKAHFTDRGTKLPAEKDAIMSKLNNIEIYPKLESALLGINLGLKGVIQEQAEESNEETLLIALISVSVILGTLLILLTIGFIIKTRSLSTRLNKLSSVKFSSNESLNVAAAPNTNRRAVEGSNPVFNTSVEDTIDYDPEPETNSLSSVDSDLFGIENSSVFMNDTDDC